MKTIKVYETHWHKRTNKDVPDIRTSEVDIPIYELYVYMTNLPEIEDVKFYSRTCFINRKIHTHYSCAIGGTTLTHSNHVTLKSFKAALRRNIKKEME
jgi:hypothetical protein